jgi:uncharacterized protein YggE
MRAPAAAALVLSALALVPSAQAQPASGTITVNGQAEVKVKPDEVMITVGVETDNMDIARARADNDTRVKAIVAAATAQGLRAEDVRSEFLDIQPRYRDESDRRTFLGYFARRSLSVTLRETARFEALLTSLLSAGANYIHGIDFRTSELRRHRDEARGLAVRAAREKAAGLASALNVTVGAPVSINEQHSGWWSPYATWWGGRYGGAMYQNVLQDHRGSTDAAETLVPGQISVTASVSVTFELGPSR